MLTIGCDGVTRIGYLLVNSSLNAQRCNPTLKPTTASEPTHGPKASEPRLMGPRPYQRCCLDRCARCEALTYSLNPSDGCLDGYCPPRPCTACPVGARCLGTPAASVFNLSRIFEPLINGSVWSLQPAPAGGVHLKRLVACPPGFILIREERFPSADQW